MATTAEAFAIAIEQHQAGNLAAAEGIYRQILAAEPENADALHLLGVVASQVGNYAAAVAYIRRAIGLKGAVAAFHGNLGNALRARGELAQAVDACRRALELGADDAESHYNLGSVLADQGAFEEAAICLRRALERRPAFPEVYNNLGKIFQAQGKLDEAIATYCKALELNAALPEAHNNLGTVLLREGEVDEAAAAFRRAIALRPDYAEAFNNLGNALQYQGRVQEALSVCRRAIELNPSCAEAYNNLGMALLAVGRLQDAEICFRRTLELKPALAEGHNNLAHALRKQGRLDEAVGSFQRAIELKPGYAEAYSNLSAALKDQGRLDEAVACCRKSIEADPQNAKSHSVLLYTLLFCPGQNAAGLYAEHRKWNAKFAEPLARFIRPHDNDRTPDRRLRIGYVSPDFYNHVVGLNMLPLLREHDRQAVDVFCYADVLCPDSITERFRSYAGTWREVAGWKDERLAEVIREDRIDILVDLTLHMSDNRLLTFARKPAPIQVTFAGYPGTTGLTSVDYRLTDVHLDPPNARDDCYSERSVRLPDSFWCYEPLGGEPEVNSLPALTRGGITFGCLTNFCKINPTVLRLWARVLRAMPGSRLMLLTGEGSHRRLTTDLLEQEGVAAERVVFVTTLPRTQYLGLYHEIDVSLDTVPYNGHTTSLDSLWMGVPVITLVGETVVGRAGLSQLTNVGLAEYVASTPEEFVRIATELAGDMDRLRLLRASLRQRMKASSLMDSRGFARGIEAAYRRMWTQWCGR